MREGYEMGYAIKNREPYEDSVYRVGSIVLVENPTHDVNDYTSNVVGLVYEAYVKGGNKMYAVVFEKRMDLYDMKDFKASTEHLSEELSCQHLEEDHLSAVKFLVPADGGYTTPWAPLCKGAEE